MRKIYTLILIMQFGLVAAQDHFPKNDGVKTSNTNYTAFINAKIHISPDRTIDKGTLLIKKDKVVGSGSNLSIPDNSIIIDLSGKSIYPSFIDIMSDFGIAMPEPEKPTTSQTQYESKRQGYYWNEHIMPEKQAVSLYQYDIKKAKALLKAGFGTVNSHIQDGIVRGNGMLIALNSKANDNQRILSSRSAQYLSFDRSKYTRQEYPSSVMGSMALLRQMYHDADWYTTGSSDSRDLSLEALNNNKDLVQIFVSNNKYFALKGHEIGNDFGIDYVLLGSGQEYEIMEKVKAARATYIVPVNFPKPYDVQDPYQSQYLSLEDMRHWNQAPVNPSVMDKNDISFAFTAYGTKSMTEFKANILKAIQYGLDKKTALAALTTVPASILKKSNEIGSLENGTYANFLITSGDIFEKETIIFENWVQGSSNEIHELSTINIAGSYNLNIENKLYKLTINSPLTSPKITVKKESTTLKNKFSYKNNWFTLNILEDSISKKYVRLSAKVDHQDHFNGMGILPDGKKTSWKALKEEAPKKAKKTKPDEPMYMSPVTFPNNGYGFDKLPEEQTTVFRNITVWTNEADGILENTDVLIKDGKIAKIGPKLQAGNAQEIDGTGKHLTSGIIDEHSHIAAFSINEWGQNSSAEVSIKDVMNPEDINIYRNLAGGVTQIQILHGSSNPIGGRSAIVKLKWGATSDEMIDKNAPKFIKFALGENVKQSSEVNSSRFPQTRMGVEQVFQDYFKRAHEYDVLKKSGAKFRTDIEMEVLAEILNKERFITCHSYVQSEINMMMKVAESFDFNINTFTHILEGYKVADKMKAHGVGGSTFSDWWAYKYEVNDAIPYNAAILHSMGIITAINSDDAEMGRRLNQEAAKSVKYGGVSEEDAWKFVTLNPAKLLHIDDRVGSIKIGKDADLVLWSGHPMDIGTKAEKTMIEGKLYFELERDAELRKALNKEKNQLTNLMLLEKDKGTETQKPEKKENRINHCDTVDF